MARDAVDKLEWMKFYPADFSRDTQHLSPATVGAYLRVLCTMHFAAEPGVVTLPIDRLAKLMGLAVRAARAAVNELGDAMNGTGKGVLDIEWNGDVVTLRSRRMIRDRRRLDVNRANGAAGGNPLLRSDKPSSTSDAVSRLSESDNRNGHAGITDSDNRPANRNGSTRVQARSRENPESRIQNPDNPAAQGRPAVDNAASAPPPPPLSAKPAKARKQSGLTPEQSPIYHGFIAWWCEQGYPAAMQGLEYPFDGANDGRAVKRLLRHAWVAWDLDRATRVANAFLRAPDQFLVRQNRPLSILGNQLQTWVLQAQKTPAQQKRREVSPYARNSNERNADGTREGEHAPRPARVVNAGNAEPEQLRDELFNRFGVPSEPPVGVTAGSADGGPERQGGGADAA